MNKQHLILITGILVIPMLFTACDKDENNDNNPQTDLSQTVTGSYKGSITSSDDPTASQDAVIVVTTSNGNTVELNMTSDMIDTTFMMNLYEHNDSVMLCFTQDRFYQEYGHHLDEDHHMMGNNEHLKWEHHKDEQHDPGDMHYGGFDTGNHHFSYRIVPTVQADKYYQFEGDKE